MAAKKIVKPLAEAEEDIIIDITADTEDKVLGTIEDAMADPDEDALEANEEGTKECPTCGEDKPIGSFHGGQCYDCDKDQHGSGATW